MKSHSSHRACRLVVLALLVAAGAGPERAVGGEALSAPKAVSMDAGELRVTFQVSESGIRLGSLLDTRTDCVLAVGGAPFFTVKLGKPGTNEQATITGSEGWRRAEARPEGESLRLVWAGPADARFGEIKVTATARLDRGANAFRWQLRVENRSKHWAVRQVVFPQLTVPELDENAAVLFPRGPGEVQRGIWRREFRYRGTYPDGWCAMPFLAAYRGGELASGLYVGVHDPWGSTKQIEVASSPSGRSASLLFEVPASGFDVAGNDFVLSGDAVWQLLRGDWFDAASIYRAWVRKEARWWPKLGAEGRTDTPGWMRELSAWVMTGGAPEDCVPAVKRFQAALGLPVGFHWYNWHQIPFDNDYPHYFPTRTNFAAGVAALQSAGVSVMPYINGRLWDSHDGGALDVAFSKVALPAATKQEDGQPYLESYGSKETNGEPVRLAVMCPATRLWQEKVREIVLRLQREEGTRGVYIDQVAAAAPKLCMDRSHGHPVGGGHWWVEGYGHLLEAIRRQMPADRMLTTECNGEPFVRWFDGYLTWHWQHDGQVPVFPAVYGGAIQMFGRAYRGGGSRDLALRMKAGQQLAFGEQIGWFDPGQAGEPQNLPFLIKAIRTRWAFRRYFHAGEMMRPPRLVGELPRVRADWQWSGEWWVTTDAVLTGAWRIPAENRAVFLFANVSDQPVKARWLCSAHTAGLEGVPLRRWVSQDGEAPVDAGPFPAAVDVELTFPPQSVAAWELRP